MSPAAKPLSATILDTRAFDVLVRRCARSFQLSLRVLPASVRPTLSLAYMLARASDTIADASSAPDFQRLALLRALPDSFPEKCPDLGLSGAERDLLAVFPQLLAAIPALPDSGEILGVWRTILGAQIFDIERFPAAEDGSPAFPLSPEELSDYTAKVAGSVGEFWTRICFKNIPGYANRPLEELLPLAHRFGQGLQLVNILRDRRGDAARGRIYIPDERFYPEMQNAAALLEAGREYAAAVAPRMLRAACLLPLELGTKTLAMVAEHPLGENLKVPRFAVWSAFFRAVFAPRP